MLTFDIFAMIYDAIKAYLLLSKLFGFVDQNYLIIISGGEELFKWAQGFQWMRTGSWIVVERKMNLPRSV